MTLSTATIQEVSFKDGIPVDKHFYAYKMPSITDIPSNEVFIKENDAMAGGVSEPGLPALRQP